MRLTLRWLLPGGLVLTLALTALRLEGRVPVPLGDVTSDYAALLYVAALALALAFHRSRVFVAVGLIALADWMHRGPGAEAAAAAVEGVEAGGAGAAAPMALLGPALVLFLGVAGLMRDRGLASPWGAVQLAIGAAMGGVAWLLVRDPAVLQGLTGPAPSSLPVPEVLGIPPTVLPFVAAGFVLSAYAAYRWRSPVERAVLWSQVIVLAAAQPALRPAEASLLLMAAGLTLGLSVLETSYAMAYRDELTGLPGRRSLMRDLDGLTGTYTLAMVDVDHFKRFNDKHGHDVGDQVLRLVASRLGRAPGGGRAYRYGGEEFTLLYRSRTRDEAAPHLEAVRADVAGARFSLRRWNRPRKARSGAGGGARKPKAKTGAAARAPRQLSVTVSIGMADSSGRDAATPEAVLKKADQALYRAKRDGRNRVSK